MATGSGERMFPMRVKLMYKTCSIDLENNGRCGNPALWAVQDERGNWWWRCNTHYNVRRFLPDGSSVLGNYTDTVLMLDEVARYVQ